MITIPPKCLECKHFHDEWTAPRTCEAFPEGIPVEIYFEATDHTKPFNGDNGIRFEGWDGQ